MIAPGVLNRMRNIIKTTFQLSADSENVFIALRDAQGEYTRAAPYDAEDIQNGVRYTFFFDYEDGLRDGNPTTITSVALYGEDATDEPVTGRLLATQDINVLKTNMDLLQIEWTVIIQ